MVKSKMNRLIGVVLGFVTGCIFILALFVNGAVNPMIFLPVENMKIGEIIVSDDNVFTRVDFPSEEISIFCFKDEKSLNIRSRNKSSRFAVFSADGDYLMPSASLITFPGNQSRLRESDYSMKMVLENYTEWNESQQQKKFLDDALRPIIEQKSDQWNRLHKPDLDRLFKQINRTSNKTEIERNLLNVVKLLEEERVYLETQKKAAKKDYCQTYGQNLTYVCQDYIP